ncbi:hypothetical protein MUK42_19160 [Musa troglodytarum]|uniref:Uncharacterized protein n=1 Tax=Musa troglodytarum TaxID=320322 RepID=A0A9E7JX91_9LILI|nr:hypothetical protein MUK42_19160 [Musa troglodytarum]
MGSATPRSVISAIHQLVSPWNSWKMVLGMNEEASMMTSYYNTIQRNRGLLMKIEDNVGYKTVRRSVNVVAGLHSGSPLRLGIEIKVMLGYFFKRTTEMSSTADERNVGVDTKIRPSFV